MIINSVKRHRAEEFWMGHAVKRNLVLGVGVSALLAFEANAQEVDGAERYASVAVDEIIVTGEKIERSLQDTTSSVAVYNEELIDNNNFIDVYDLINQTANVSGAFGDQGFTIRGLRNTGASSGDQTSDVSTVYLDGVFLPSALFAQGAFNLWDIQSVEIFRGPQSTIQGRNALAGAIVARTLDPGSEFSATGQLLYGSFETFRGSAAVTIPVIKDEVALRLAGDITSTRGFNDNLTLGTDDGDNEEAVTARGKLLVTPSALPGLTARFNATYVDSDRGENRVEEALFPAERVSLQNVEDRRDTEATILSAEFQYDITDNLSVTSVTAFIDSLVNFKFDTDNQAIGSTEPGFTIQDDQVLTQEVRFTFSNDRFDALLGGYFFDSNGDFSNGSTSIVDSQFALPDGGTLASLLFMTPMPSPLQVAQGNAIRDQIIGFAPSFPVVFDRRSTDEIRNYAVFGEATFRATDRLSFTFGARYDIESIDQTAFDSTLVPPFPPSGNPVVDQVLVAAATTFSNVVDIRADNDFNAFLPKGVIKYDWTDDLSTSFSVQRGYRAGGLSFNIFRGALAEDVDSDGQITQSDLEALGIVNSFDPEFTTNYEFAFRSQWFDKRLTLNANAFYINYDDQQINVLLSANPLDSITDNVGASRLFGFEVEATANPIEGLDLFANVGFSDTEFTESADLAATDLTGLEFSFAPRWTAGAGGRYTFANGLFANLRTRYTDESFSIVENDPTGINDAFFLVDVIIGYEGESFGIELFANNLFDEEYFTQNTIDTPDGMGGFEPSQGAIAQVGAPRVIGARLVAGF
ncbi:MAG: TonB-dependent receptor [Pseudomonadota bacterium]